LSEILGNRAGVTIGILYGSDEYAAGLGPELGRDTEMFGVTESVRYMESRLVPLDTLELSFAIGIHLDCSPAVRKARVESANFVVARKLVGGRTVM